MNLQEKGLASRKTVLHYKDDMQLTWRVSDKGPVIIYVGGGGDFFCLSMNEKT